MAPIGTSEVLAARANGMFAPHNRLKRKRQLTQMRISPRSIVRHPIHVKVALGPKQGTASGNPPLTAPFPNFPADKEESCQSDKNPPAPDEPLPPDSELCGENCCKKQEPQTSD